MKPFPGNLSWPAITLVALCAAGTASAAPKKRVEAKPATAKPATPAGLTALEISPATVTLDGPRSEQTLLVSARFPDGTVRDVTSRAAVRVSNPKAVALDADSRVVRPLTDGEGMLTASYAGKSAQAAIRVSGIAAPPPVNFVRDVMPVVTRVGCNSAACHGAQAGKGGFKLSLFGYDAAADYQAIVGTDAQPRVNRPKPEESLLLKKATLAMQHGGGKRIVAGSLNYRVLKDWIAGGAAQPGTAPALTRLEVYPAERLFPEKGLEQRLLVRAHYADGTQRDVTSLSRFDAQDTEAMEVTDDGVVTPTKKGVNAVMVRYGEQVTTFRALIPYQWPLPKITYPTPANAVDDRVFARLQRLGLPLSGAVDDLEFFRRVMLDLCGSLPTPDEVRQFAADKDPNKRAKLIDRLLEREEHHYFWAQKFSDLFKVNSRDLGQNGMFAYYSYFFEAIRGNKRWDQMARELLNSDPRTAQTDATGAYYLTARTPEDRAMATAEVFVGVRVQCAQCHKHPFEKWTQDDFWQFAAFFTRVPELPQANIRRLGDPEETPAPPPTTGEVMNPRTKQAAFPPKPLGGPMVSDPAMQGDRRREALTQWLTAPENPFFARVMVNRVWRHFFGKGIVDPVDDHRESNPPSDPELLDMLTRQFVSSGYDIRALMRLMVNSRTYQTSSTPVAGNREDTRFWSHSYFRRMTAEQLADAIAHATGIPNEYPGYERGLRAIQLPDPQIEAPFLDVFGRPGRTQACECERTNDPSIAQALKLITGDGLSNKATAGNGRISRMLFYSDKTPDDIWEELYLWTLSRPPSTAERAAWKEHVAAQVKANPNNGTGVTIAALEDWFWALLNSKEFLFNH